MKRTTGVLIALVCGSSLAIAQAPDRSGDHGGGWRGGDGGGFSRGGGGGDARGFGGGDRGAGGVPEPRIPEPRVERSVPEPRVEREAPSRAAEPRVERPERQATEPRERLELRSPRRAERNDADRKEALERKREARDADRASRDKEPSNKAAEQADAKNKRDRDGSSSAEGRAEGESGRGVETHKRGDTADRATKRDRPAQLAGEKRDRVRTVFREKGHAKRRTGANIDISLGRRLPRNWDYYTVPIEIVEIVPEYRGYVFVYVDDEYVVCDPDTYEVVAVIPVGDGPSYAGGSGRAACSRNLVLNRDERDLLVELAPREDEVDVSDLEVGWSVPNDIELHEFPEPVLDRADELGACRYFVADDSIAIVDPDESKVVLVIDRS